MNDIPNALTPLWFYNTFVLPIYFDDDLDSYQKLLKIQYKINEIIKNQTGIIEWLNQLKGWIDTQLELYAKEQLNEWLSDGTLEKIINQMLLNEKQTYFDTLTNMLLSINLVPGMIVRTYGYSDMNDNGGGSYMIKPLVEPLNALQGKINDELMWELLPVNGYINLKQLGIIGNDISDLLNKFDPISAITEIELLGSYDVNNTVTFNRQMKIYNGKLSVNNLKYCFLANNNFICHDIEFNCNWNSSQILRITGGEIDISKCEFFNLDNTSLRSETICPILTYQCSGSIHDNYIHDMKKTTSVAGSNSCCGLAITDSNIDIYNNTIENLHPLSTEELIDYDGIIVKGNSNKTFIHNNTISNVSGRFIKLQTPQIRVYDNTFSNIDIEIIQNFRGVDCQWGDGDIQRNNFTLNVEDIKSSIVFTGADRETASYLVFKNNIVNGNWFYVISFIVSNTNEFMIDIQNNYFSGSVNRIGSFQGALSAILILNYIGNSFKRIYNTFAINLTGDLGNYLRFVFTSNSLYNYNLSEVIPFQSGSPIKATGNVKICNNSNFNEVARITPNIGRCGNARFIFLEGTDIVGAPSGFQQNVIVEGVRYVNATSAVVKLTKLSDGTSTIVGFTST